MVWCVVYLLTSLHMHWRWAVLTASHTCVLPVVESGRWVCAHRHSFSLVVFFLSSLDVYQNWCIYASEHCSVSLEQWMPVGDPVIVRKLKQRNGQLILFGASGEMNRVPFHKSQDYLAFCHLTSPFPSAHTPLRPPHTWPHSSGCIPTFSWFLNVFRQDP